MDDDAWNQHLTDLHRLVASISQMDVEIVVLIGDSVESFVDEAKTCTQIDQVQAVFDQFRPDIRLVCPAHFLFEFPKFYLSSRFLCPVQ